jgi:predicted PurR-regulated permease PerM
MNPISLNKKLWFVMTVIFFVLIGIFFMIAYFFKIFIYIIIAFLISYLMSPVIRRLEQEGIKRKYALSFVLIGFLFIIVVLFYMITPVLVVEVESIIDGWPDASKRINDEILTEQKINGTIMYYSPLLKTEIGVDQIDKLENMINTFVTTFLTFSLEIFYALVIIPVLIVILIKDGYKIKKNLYSFIPNKYFEIIISIIEGIYESIGKFSRAKMIQSVIVSIITIIGFFLIDLKGAIILGLIAGILNIIPYLGPILSLIPVAVVSYLFHDLRMTLLSFIIVGIAQLIDNIVTQPVIIPKMIKEHPLIVILLILAGSKIYGPLGMVLAIPLFSILRIVFTRVYNGLEVLYLREEKNL